MSKGRWGIVEEPVGNCGKTDGEYVERPAWNCARADVELRKSWRGIEQGLTWNCAKGRCGEGSREIGERIGYGEEVYCN